MKTLSPLHLNNRSYDYRVRDKDDKSNLMSFGGRVSSPLQMLYCFYSCSSTPALLEIGLIPSYHSKKIKELIKCFHFTGDTFVTPNASPRKNHLLWDFVNIQVWTQIQQEILCIYMNYSFLGVMIATAVLLGKQG